MRSSRIVEALSAMLVRAPRIVRFLSVSRSETWRVTRPRKPTTETLRRSPTPPPPLSPTPVPPEELLDRAAELQGLVGELADLTGCGGAWGIRMLRRNVELALLSPHTLDSADNQLDFIEELAEAVWDGGEAGFRHALAPSPAPDETVQREWRRRAVVARLDDLAHQLCVAAEAWRDVVVATAEAARAEVAYPQEDHSS
jgi:hypothetical protein